MTTFNKTPQSLRLHIGIFGVRNSGKSSLMNSLTGHNSSVVSDYAGTTTDPVNKSIELYGLGPCVLMDTAGFDDIGPLGELRIKKTEDIFKKTDIAILLFPSDSEDESYSKELIWLDKLKSTKKPTLTVISKSDLANDNKIASIRTKLEKLGYESLEIINGKKGNQHKIRERLVRLLPEEKEKKSIVEGLVKKDDLVMLVMPQQINAPQGRLILPQVQTTRDLLDHHCIIVSVSSDEMISAFKTLTREPDLIITDSQMFSYVWAHKPKSSKLTSFSILLSAIKGDVRKFALGAEKIDELTKNSRVLIAEACTHAPLAEDIGRVQIPALLRKKYGTGLRCDIVSGNDFPEDLTPYDLIIHCGGCMFNRNYLMDRLNSAEIADVPMTNYGMAIAKINGILDRVEL